MDLQENRFIQDKMIANIGDVIVIVDKNGINQYKSANVHPEDHQSG